MDTEKLICLLEDALYGTCFDNCGNRDDDGLLFACKMGWLENPYRRKIGELKDALDELKNQRSLHNVTFRNY